MQKTSLSIVGLALLAVSAAPPGSSTRAGAPGEPLIGITVPSKMAAVAPEQAGKIVSIPVAEGMLVAADDVLFQLNSKLEQLEVNRLRDLAESDLNQRRAEASLRYAEQQEARVRDLREKDIASDRDLQAQAYEVELARLRVQQASLEQAQARNELAQTVERLTQRTVHSPFAGIVTRRFKSEGEAVEKFVPVVEVMSLDPLWIEFDCPVTDQQWFRVGGEVVVAPAVRPEAARVATILFVSPKATASSHTFMVRAAVANEGLHWKTGLKMVIQMPAPTPPGKPGK